MLVLNEELSSPGRVDAEALRMPAITGEQVPTTLEHFTGGKSDLRAILGREFNYAERCRTLHSPFSWLRAELSSKQFSFVLSIFDE